MVTTSWKNDNPGCNCDCCNCANGYAAIAALWSQIEADVNGPLPFTAPTEFFAASNGVICGDGLEYAYEEAANSAFIPNRLQIDGPADCDVDAFGVPMFGLFLFLRYDGTGTTCLGPAVTYNVSAVCIGGVLYYCWLATLGYQVMASSDRPLPPVEFNDFADCHGVHWLFPLLPDGNTPEKSSYSNTIGDETTTSVPIYWPSGSGLNGNRYAVDIVVTKQGCSTDIADVPTSFNLAPEYNPAGISVDFTLS